METLIRNSDYVIIVCPETYYLREVGKEVPGTGQGVGWEGMGLHLADCHLGYARLHSDMGDKHEALESLVTGKDMIKNLGYNRRDG